MDKDKKIVFIDVDGTLCNDLGMVPNSARASIQKARQNGHLVYLCTGRSIAELFEWIMDIGFDGVIGAGGGFAISNKKMLYHKKVSNAALKHAVDYFNHYNVDFYLESNGGLFCSKNLISTLEKKIYGDVEHDSEAKKKKEKGHWFIDALIQDENLYREDVNKISFISHTITFEEIKKEFENEFTVIHNTVANSSKDSGELGVPNVNKSTAIKTLLQHLNIPKENTIAIGDGLNDIEMIGYCHIGIAMGNAKEELKRIANEITLTHDQGGIEHSLKNHQLI